MCQVASDVVRLTTSTNCQQLDRCPTIVTLRARCGNSAIPLICHILNLEHSILFFDQLLLDAFKYWKYWNFHEFDLSWPRAFGGECQQKEKFRKLAKSLMADFKSPRELVLVSVRVTPTFIFVNSILSFCLLLRCFWWHIPGGRIYHRK